MSAVLKLVRIAMLALALPTAASAAGDDHGVRPVVVSPRVEARVGSRQFVLVYANRQMFEDRQIRLFGNVQRVKYDRPRLALFIEDYATGAPTTGATVSATVNFLPLDLTEIAPGVYVSEEIVLGGGRNEVEVAYTIGAEDGTVPLLLAVAGGVSAGTSGSAAAVSAVPPAEIPGWLFVAGGVAVYAAAAGLFMLRRRRAAAGEPVQQA
ncbi:MAG: hypothetical protein AB7N54_02775 [Alphaproteobacteria bacterium]